MRILVVTSKRNWRRLRDVATALQRRGHEVLVATSPPGATAPDIADTGARWIGSPPALPAPWRAFALRARHLIDYLHYLGPGHTASATWRARARQAAVPRGLRWAAPTGPLSPSTQRRWLHALAALERASEAPTVFDAFLRAHAPGLIVVAPLVQAAAEQDDIVSSARRLGVPTALVAATWDTFVNKGRLRAHPDAVIVWNETHRRHAIELHDVDPSRVIVAGAPPFDRWLHVPPAGDRDAFCRRVGLPADRPIVLFVGSNRSITPVDAEQQLVRRWLDAIRSAASPLLREASVLIRPYPTATHWANADLSQWGPVHISRASHPDWDQEARNDLTDALSHAAAVVGINTSVMIDAAVMRQPVLSVLADEFAPGQSGSLHFADLRPERGGCLALARTMDEHMAQLADAIARPERFQPRLDAFVRWFVRPLDDTTPATSLVADALERVGARGAVPTAARNRARWLYRLVSLPAALAVTGVALIRRSPPRRGTEPAA